MVWSPGRLRLSVRVIVGLYPFYFAKKDIVLNDKRIHLHDFWHSHASNLIANGVNIVAVSKRLGHTDVSMTLSIYTHLLEKNENELIDDIEENFITTGYLPDSKK